MMRLFTGLLIILPVFSSFADTWFSEILLSDTWVEGSSPINQAHKKLLNNDLEGSFSSIIQVWQTDTNEYVEQHLNELLLKSQESDCGKSISNEPIASWIDNITIKRQEVHSPGRNLSRVIIDILSDLKIKEIVFTRWPDSLVSSESNFEYISTNTRVIFRKSYELQQRLSKGLYKLEVMEEHGRSWSTWIVMEESAAKKIVRWDSKDTWAVDQLALLNPYCAFPKLKVSLYDHIEDEYTRVWHREYEGDYPKSMPVVPVSELKPDRYVLAVGMVHQRWQGSIVIEDQQVISKTYDISSE